MLTIILYCRNNKQEDRYNAMTSWSLQLKSLSTALVQKGPSKGAGPEGDFGMGMGGMGGMGGPWATPLEMQDFDSKEDLMAFVRS